MFIKKHFESAIVILQEDNGKLPLAHFLKQYFAQYKKYGSRDRKQITHLCYCFYRLGKSLPGLAIEEKLKIAIYLCNNNANAWQVLFDDTWNEWSENLHERISFVQKKYPFSITGIFPWKDELSGAVDVPVFIESHLVQPDLFLRIRPDKLKTVSEKLNHAQISYNKLSETCLQLPNNTKIETVLNIDEEVVVQDYSSQRIVEFLKLITYNSSLITLWDCCAASGGKSILAKDVLSDIDLTVSDVRSSILKNLQERFAKAGIKKYHSFVTDLAEVKSQKLKAKNSFTSHFSLFDLVLCDVPCSGSGTWGRTPEQLFFFDTKKINEFHSLQTKIVSNTIPQVKEGGYFLYITCSVFKKENEKVVEFIQQKFPFMQLLKKEVLVGYDKKADTMFAALFKKGSTLRSE